MVTDNLVAVILCVQHQLAVKVAMATTTCNYYYTLQMKGCLGYHICTCNLQLAYLNAP